MHDIDTTQLELEDQEAWETPEAYQEESGAQGNGEWETEGESEADYEGILNEGEVEELAAELMSVANEPELDQFVGTLLKNLARKGQKGGLGAFLQKAGGPLFRAFKGLAKQTLPFVTGALGSVVPGIGTVAGTAVGSAAADLLEAELEGLNPEDREFEQSKRYIRVLRSTVANGARRRYLRNPRAAVNLAMRSALTRLGRHLAWRRGQRGYGGYGGYGRYGGYGGYGAYGGTQYGRGTGRYRRRYWPHGGYGQQYYARPCPPCPPPEPSASAPPDDGGVGASPTGSDGGQGGEPSNAPPSPAGGAPDSAGEWEFAEEAFEPPSPGTMRTGRWIRRGTKIVLLGV